MAKLSFIVKADRTPVTKLIQSIDELEKKVRHIQNSDLNFNKWLKAFDDLQKKVQEKKDSLEKLKSQMLSLDIAKMPHTKITLETNYAKVRKEYEELANEVGQASLKFDRAYKGMLDDLLLAEKNTDSVTSKMIEQKKVVSDLTSEIKRLNAEKKLSTSQTQKDSLAEQAEKTKVKLEEERATLNKLRESQEKAKLTVKGLKDEVRGYEKVTGKVAGTQAAAFCLSAAPNSARRSAPPMTSTPPRCALPARTSRQAERRTSPVMCPTCSATWIFRAANMTSSRRTSSPTLSCA